MESFVKTPDRFPAWIGPGEPPYPDPAQIIFGKASNLYIPTMEIFPPSPHWFNLGRLDFDYDPDRRLAPAWIDFLASLFKDDLQSMDTLMEMIGLLISSITKFQKMFCIIGPPRSGKGTIARIIRKLVGILNYCGPTTDSLTETFGLQPLLDKSVAIVSDARFGGRNLSILAERLLAIAGEDIITVHRKHQDAVHVQLPTRFVFLTNEIPRLTDASGALASRFIVIKLTNSFLGREDLELEDRLTGELPDILYMALRALRDLLNRGHFVQPDAAKDDLEMLQDLGSPISAFVRDRCELLPAAWTSSDDLWAAWQAWCEEEGRDGIGTKSMFFQRLNAAVTGIRRTRRTDMSNNQFYAYEGIRLVG